MSDQRLLAPFVGGLNESLAEVIVACDELTIDELEQVIEAAQLVDSEAQDFWEAKRAEQTRPDPDLAGDYGAEWKDGEPPQEPA